MKINENAYEIVRSSLYEKTTYALYKNIGEMASKGFESVFCSSFQNFISRLGMIVNQALVDPKKTTPSTYLGAVDYICLKVLKNQQIHKIFKSINGINDQANDVKHSLKSVNLNIENVLDQYNLLIKYLLKSTNISSFKFYFINKGKPQKNKPSVIEATREKFSVKHFILGDVNFDCLLSPKYKYDPYNKKIIINLAVKYASKFEGRILLYVKLAKTDKTVFETQAEYNEHTKKISANVPIDKSELEGNCCKLHVYIWLQRIDTFKREERETYTTGIIFTHYKVRTVMKDVRDWSTYDSIDFEIGQQLSEMIE